MTQLVSGDEMKPAERVCDPCCGSGRMLLSAAMINRNRTFVGQDVDLRCVRMTAINLALHNLYGYVIWGNSLTLEQKLVYQTGFNGKGVIREVRPAPADDPPPQPVASVPVRSEDTIAEAPTTPDDSTLSQGQLFELE